MTNWQIAGLVFFTIFFLVMSYYYTWSALRKDDINDEDELK